MADASASPGAPGVDTSSLDALLGQSMARTEAKQAEYQSAVKEPLSRMKKLDKESDALKVPDLLKLPEEPHPKLTDPVQAFGSPATWLAIFGGLLTKRPLQASMDASAKVLNAYHAQDNYAAELAFKEWQAETKNALTLHQFQQDQFQNAFVKLKDKRADAVAELTALSAAFKNDAASEMIRARDWVGFENYMRGMSDQGRKLNESMLRFGPTAEVAAERMDRWKTYKDSPEFKTDSESTHVKRFNEIFTPSVAAAETRAGAAKKPGATSLSPDAVNMAAEIYLTTHQMPSFGMGGAADREAVLNRAAEKAKEQGTSVPDILSSASSYKADTSSLTALQKMADAATSFEGTALDNIKIIRGLMDKGAGTEAGPVINRWLQAGKKETGDPDVKALNAAIVTVMDEYAKILSGNSSGAARTTDAAKAQTNEMMSDIDSPAAMTKVLNDVIVPDMHNRRANYDKQLTTIKDRIGTSGKSPPPAASADDIKSKATAAWGAYEPDAYDYRVDPATGALQRKAK